MHYEDHIAAVGEIFVVLGQILAYYIEWFFRISHPFVTPTQVGDQPKHPPAPQHEEYIEPSIPKVPVRADVGPSQALAVVRLIALMFYFKCCNKCVFMNVIGWL